MDEKPVVATQEYVVTGRIQSDRLYLAGETVKLTEAQAKRGLASGALAKPGSKEATAAAEEAKGRAAVETDRAARSEALDEVPFTGNTAGQPIAKSDIPMNVSATPTAADADKATAKASRASGPAPGPAERVNVEPKA